MNEIRTAQEYKEKLKIRESTKRGIEIAKQQILKTTKLEDILNYNWLAEVNGRHIDFWTNEQGDAFKEMSPFKQENISIEYVASNRNRR